MDSIIAHKAALDQRVRQAAVTAGRVADAVRLVAVSKMQPVEAVQVLLDGGHRLFGENRVQEAKRKFLPLRAVYPDIELHLIGPLQTNKAADAVRFFDVIETLDRPQLAEALAKAIKKEGRNVPCYIEVNIGEEVQKTGIGPHQLGDFLRLCRDTYGLRVTGLMCIPPLHQEPQVYFKEMRQLADQYALPHLSMGMSADFEIAIREGATEVRLGTILFGARREI